VSVKPQEAKSGLLDKTASRLREKLPADQAAKLETFVRLYYDAVASADLLERGVLDLYGAALAHWNLAHQRTPGTAKVRVYTPQLEEHGWQSAHTVVEIVNDDMPFLVDSVSMELNRLDSAVHLIIHPVLKVRRDEAGALVEVLPYDAPEEGIHESFIHVEIDRETEAAQLEKLTAGLARVLGEVRAAVEDWPKMLEQVREIGVQLEREPPPIDPEELTEATALLEWLADGHFTFLGYREYDLVTEAGEDSLRRVDGTGLGILRETSQESVSPSFAKLQPEVRRLARAKNPLTLTKANSRATIHRPSYLDYVGVKRFDASGEVVGERRFLGLYTSSAYSMSPREIPLLRRKVARVRERTGFPPGSHDDKAFVEVIDTYPRDELFQISEEDLLDIAVGIVRLGERQRVRLFLRRDTFGRFLSCLVFVPRDRFNTDVRQRIQDILQDTLGGISSDYTTRISESVLARLHFIIHTKRGATSEYDVAEIEDRLVEATRSWTDDLHDALIEQCGEERGTRHFSRYEEAFPAAYRDDFTARAAVLDIERIERLDPEDDLDMTLYRPLEARPGFFCFKLLRSGQPILLSHVLPLLENMGVKVFDERPYEIAPTGGHQAWIYDFGLTYEDGEFELDRLGEAFKDAFAKAWAGEVEDDDFNRLVLRAGLTWREIALLRAVSRYLRQTGSTFSQAYMQESLASNPEIVRLLAQLFHVRFDPNREDRRAEEANRLAVEIEEKIDAVESLDDDRILRSFLRVIQATLRTNYFQRGDGGKPKAYLAFKLDPALVPDLPLPRPRYEIFVYSPRTEGVHLRGGKVARGGIRWSDRREDFRTEILGLMKAQMVKNAVIVPVGAKGGFVVKRPPPAADRDALRKEVVACYRTLISGLLDLTDNLVGGEIVPPAALVRYDEDDPYLVVAADKGTATFSDIANELSEDYGFWLGDAFASGGSTGYDHKGMGITARGAWESVKRHFRELGVDIETTDFTVAGIGDMAGDVFGNGMLLSPHIKLVGAFNHEHVFLDPDPDPEASFRERERLFQLPRSSWSDYDSRLISKGGGVFARAAKSIPLSSQVRERLAVDAEALTPNELIRALLKAPVDLLWNGGIGTFVKASHELHAEVGDKANDALRVDASELRCRVVGEGGNLGFTQRGRVEFALAGGRINTDAIDNSGGVDCSDHEVNIKILLDAIVADGDLTEKQRNALLVEMTDDVAAHVLRNNYEQTQALSLAEAQAGSMLDVHARLIHNLDQSGKLDRGLEFLPGEDVIAERKAAEQGLVSPELSVLLAYSKIALYEELLASDLPEDPYLSVELDHYFPAILAERFRDWLPDHRLRRELIATHLTNSLVNRAGMTFAFRLGEETGAAAPDIARAYSVAREVFDLRGLWGEIEALDNRIAAEVQLAMLLEGRKLVERATRWLVRNQPRPLDIAAAISYFAPGAAMLGEAVPRLLVGSDRSALERTAGEYVEAGVPPELATRVAGLGKMFSALDIVEVAGARRASIEDVAAVYYALGGHLQLHWLRDQITTLPRENRWQALARAALRDELYSAHSALAGEVLQSGPAGLDPERRIAAWEERDPNGVERCRQVLVDIRMGGVSSLETLSVAIREVRNLVSSTARVAAPPSPREAEEPAAPEPAGFA
jgi:glutamate dehydrogenase